MRRERMTLRRPDGSTKKVTIWHPDTAEDMAEIDRKIASGEIEPMLPDTLPATLARRARDRRREIAARQRKAQP